jgi:hypothetical protein
VKIKRNVAMTIDEFAEQNDLTMVITEKHLPVLGARFFAQFEGAEMMVIEGNMLGSAFRGEGVTEREAIDDYARKISCTKLTINAFAKDQRNIPVPPLTVARGDP